MDSKDKTLKVQKIIRLCLAIGIENWLQSVL